jgi:hypothetical protein
MFDFENPANDLAKMRNEETDELAYGAAKAGRSARW